MSSASCCSFLVVVAFMSSKFLHRWSSDCFMSEMSESRCFGAMVVGGVKMLLGSDGGNRMEGVQCRVFVCTVR